VATVAELMTWTLMETPLKAFLSVSGSGEDSNLQLWLGAMAAACDSHLDITDEDDEFTTLPDPVKLAVFMAVEILRHRHGLKDGLTYSTTNALAESYKEAFASDAAFASQRTLLAPYVYDPTKTGRS